MPLTGRHVVVTRPAGQAAHFATALTEQGAIPVLYPVLEIRDIEDAGPVLDAAIRLDSFDLAVFVSPNAIEKALALILPRRSWPAALRVAALGKSSERELARNGIHDVISPPLRFDSEALLELPELTDVAGKRVIIFRGNGGRDVLGDTLKARGASIEYVACYRRARPQTDPAPLLKLWEQGRLDAVTLTSSEGLRNFFDMLGHLGQAWLKKTPAFVPHVRIAAQAQALGLTNVIPTDPGDDGLMAGLMQYFASHGNSSSN
ncbi:uroporphyrinogen-III synthase [Sulfuritalea hydrogenivorans]|jgi:uroporphyrinogen-III synthase|uniref:Uroporphyrinogen-III synthase n=1 Tax=Sulfuritalea hydrogenivorans sk43H TaxID=1223802 RepID=W0SLU8_9PROT|nr:uroporphyrinogen-III synthase [Sulfuritalea hydrogenivorans]MDK9714849.1 uroporphyrinogen-III synthase [Sulfuritalea sp.]BAO30773.1 uroporphyrinogen-III synthase [Sulfuritalea hydrogenivorans sk43H]